MITPLSFARPFSVNERLDTLERQVAELQELVAHLSAAGGGALRHPEPLRQRNVTQKTEAHRLDAEIAKLLDGHPLADELTGRQIREALRCAGYSPLPAERTVRLHLAQIRGNGNTAGIASSNIRTSCQEL